MQGFLPRKSRLLAVLFYTNWDGREFQRFTVLDSDLSMSTARFSETIYKHRTFFEAESSPVDFEILDTAGQVGMVLLEFSEIKVEKNKVRSFT